MTRRTAALDPVELAESIDAWFEQREEAQAIVRIAVTYNA